MAELLHNFTAGKMNKDYDDRLVPNGEYRDALNLEITDSDGSDIGTLQNIRANVERSNKGYNASTGVFTPWTTSYINALTNPICVGKIIDNTTEKLYWFIASDEVSAIAEYDQSKDVITPILVDTENILKFSKDYLITGINIIEGILLFTDNQTEPKSFNINEFKALNTPNFLTHTQIYGRNFEEQDITTIKKKPLTALGVDASPSNRGGLGTGITPVTTVYPGIINVNGFSTLNFTYIPDPIGEPGEEAPLPTFSAYSAAAPGFYPAGLNGKVTIITNMAGNFRNQDTITLRTTIVGPDLVSTEYSIRLLVEGPLDSNQQLLLGSTLICQIQSIPSNLPRGLNPYVWEVLLDEISPLYNLIFPRFSYRWKYSNNNVSAFAPFTNVVFLGDEFKYLSSNGYNTGMTNNVRKLILNNIDWGNDDVAEVEILYKTSNAVGIYSLAKLKRVDGLVPDYTVTNEIIGAALESLQLLRPYDNVPRKAKAQEIVANRLMFGNYTQQYDLTTPNIVVSLSLNTRDLLTHPIGTPMPSLKSIRTYQIGLCLLDEYGRETPVFSSNASASIVQIIDSKNSTSLQALVPSSWNPPAWATHFKYFVKEVSNEYYNLALDRYYPAEDGNIWLSFPSSERNKLQVEDYIILKKQHNSDVPVSIRNRYKVLAINSEVPIFVASTNVNIASAVCTTLSYDKPVENAIMFTVTGPSSTQNNNFFTGIDSSRYITISDGAFTTDSYKIASGGPNGTNLYTFKLEKLLGADASFLNALPDGSPITINIIEKRVENLPEFEGRFFAKINLDTLLQTNVIDPFTNKAPVYATLSDRAISSVIPGFGGGDATQTHAFVENSSADAIDWRTGVDLGRGQPPTFGSRNVSYVIAGFPQTNSDGVNDPTLDNVGALLFNYFSRLGTSLRFIGPSGEVSQVYRVSKSTGINKSRRGDRDVFNKQRSLFSNSRVYCAIVLNKPFAETWTPVDVQAITEVNPSGNSILSSTNPAIFETEPKESVDLKLFYQASDAFDINDVSDVKTLSWFNCFSYGNGVESNRIRDDYNAPTIDKGPVVSSTLDIPYQEEVKLGGIIYSGIFNSISGVNNLNQFVQADTITKNLNPYYGSIQAFLSRDTDLVTFCEDKILNIIASKDALYNADGNAQLTASNNVLGQVTPYVGEFGISKNPESLASYGFRTYFTDKSRGTVLRLSRDGLEPIGDKGMSAFFFDNLPLCDTLVGSFNDSNSSYNLTLSALSEKWQALFATGQFDRTNPDCSDYVLSGLVPQTTVTFKENADGWTSRMSFIQEAGCSLNSTFYTFKNGRIWDHNTSTTLYNNFYGVQYDCSVNVLINESPEMVKGFKTLNYTGSRQREYVYSIGGARNYSIAEIQANNLTPTSFSTKKGWYANYVATDLQEGQVKEFIKKEGKFFNYIKGLKTFFNTNCDNNVNTQEFAVQGIGRPSSITGDVLTTGFAIRVYADPDC